MIKAEGLEYESHGEGEAVLLIHGSHVADAFLPLAREAALADRYRLIRSCLLQLKLQLPQVS